MTTSWKLSNDIETKQLSYWDKKYKYLSSLKQIIYLQKGFGLSKSFEDLKMKKTKKPCLASITGKQQR